MGQSGDVSGVKIGGLCVFFNDGMNDSEGGGILSLDQWVLDAIGFKLTGEALVQSGVGLGVWGFYGIREDIQEVGFH